MKKVLLVDKPSDWTSFDVVAKLRGALKKKYLENNKDSKRIKVGHAGTLDPFATGLLLVLIGDATKDQDGFMKLDKEYEATLKFGFTSTTGDPEGELRKGSERIPKISEIESVFKKFSGKIKQTPSVYSAIKIKGRPAYEYARAGEKVKIKSRIIEIYELRIMNYEYPILKIKVGCSSGTYIRTLAEDIGEELGVGAYLTALRRTRIGDYSIKDAKDVNKAILGVTF